MIGDIKRGDIGSTSAAYATGHLGKVKVGSKEYVPFALLQLFDIAVGDTFNVYGFTAESMDAQKPVLTVTTAPDKDASADFGTTTTPCPTGDAAPIAMITAAAAACVMLGLVVAVKKKRETV